VGKTLKIFQRSLPGNIAIILFLAVSLTFLVVEPVVAATSQSSGSVGIEGIIPSPPPSRAATIAVPANGALFSTIPITISGICPSGLLIKIFDDNAFVGSSICSSGGSYSLQASLFSGTNQLVARDYDSLNQNGPDSNTVTVTFNDAQFTQLGTPLTITSAYAEKGAQPGSELSWPIILSGGTGPYAISVDWGDNTPSELLSESYAGTININHTYNSAGVYTVVIKATDKNGSVAFLQLVGQATGAVQKNNSATTGNGSNTTIEKSVLWWPVLIMIPLLLITFCLGRRHELYVLRKRLQSDR
jgi:hypothetical protein